MGQKSRGKFSQTSREETFFGRQRKQAFLRFVTVRPPRPKKRPASFSESVVVVIVVVYAHASRIETTVLLPPHHEMKVIKFCTALTLSSLILFYLLFCVFEYERFGVAFTRDYWSKAVSPLDYTPVIHPRAANSTGGKNINGKYECSEIVSPLDYPPIRSPQAVHSVIAEKVQDKDVIELGTRNGDGMSCFARFASTATAVEYDRTYCARLKKRASLQSPFTWSVQCVNAFRYKNFDADIITWWQQNPLTNFAVLERLKKEQCAGRIRPSAEAILIFDEKWPKDMKDLGLLSDAFTWQQRIPFDEERMCVEYATEGESDLCHRSKGAFIVASLSIAQLPFFSCSK